MAFDAPAVANALLSVLQDLEALDSSQIGAPEDVGTRVAAYVTMGSHSKVPKTTGTTRRETRFMVMFLYRVGSNETAAELALMGVVDDFMAALDADRTLGGVVKALEAESQLADEPSYVLRAGQEYREYPVLVMVTQYATYATNP